MPRQISLTPAANPAAQNLTVNRGEAARIVLLEFADRSSVLTIAVTAGAEPLIEIPGGSEIDLPPAVLVSLDEGRRYNMNIWEVTDDPVLLFTGTIVTQNTIAPTGAVHATQFLVGGGRIVKLTQAEYDALEAPDPDTIYVTTV